MGQALICTNPEAINISLLVPKEMWPEVVSEINRLGITYVKERQINHEPLVEYVKLCGLVGRGEQMMSLFKTVDFLAFMMESKAEEEGIPVDNPCKKNCYVMFQPRRGKRRKADVRKGRQEADTGREGGNTGEADQPA